VRSRPSDEFGSRIRRFTSRCCSSESVDNVKDAQLIDTVFQAHRDPAAPARLKGVERKDDLTVKHSPATRQGDFEWRQQFTGVVSETVTLPEALKFHSDHWFGR